MCTNNFWSSSDYQTTLSSCTIFTQVFLWLSGVTRYSDINNYCSSQINDCMSDMNNIVDRDCLVTCNRKCIHHWATTPYIMESLELFTCFKTEALVILIIFIYWIAILSSFIYWLVYYTEYLPQNIFGELWGNYGF